LVLTADKSGVVSALMRAKGMRNQIVTLLFPYHFLLSIGLSSGTAYSSQGPPSAAVTLDLDGLTWIEGDHFLAIYHSENPEEKGR
jgi:hypothetical protein